jgi:hypothetical protein
VSGLAERGDGNEPRLSIAAARLHGEPSYVLVVQLIREHPQLRCAQQRLRDLLAKECSTWY